MAWGRLLLLELPFWNSVLHRRCDFIIILVFTTSGLFACLLNGIQCLLAWLDGHDLSILVSSSSIAKWVQVCGCL